MIAFGLRPVEFDDQQRLGIKRIAGVHKRLGRVRCRLVHHFHARRNDPCGNDGRHRLARRLNPGKPDQQRARGFGARQDRHGHLGHHAQQPFGPDHQAQQIKTISTPSTLLVVRPYFRQCTPPEFSATLPPIEQAIWLDGSGA